MPFHVENTVVFPLEREKKKIKFTHRRPVFKLFTVKFLYSFVVTEILFPEGSCDIFQTISCQNSFILCWSGSCYGTPAYGFIWRKQWNSFNRHIHRTGRWFTYCFYFCAINWNFSLVGRNIFGLSLKWEDVSSQRLVIRFLRRALNYKMKQKLHKLLGKNFKQFFNGKFQETPGIQEKSQSGLMSTLSYVWGGRFTPAGSLACTTTSETNPKW